VSSVFRGQFRSPVKLRGFAWTRWGEKLHSVRKQASHPLRRAKGGVLQRFIGFLRVNLEHDVILHSFELRFRQPAFRLLQFGLVLGPSRILRGGDVSRYLITRRLAAGRYAGLGRYVGGVQSGNLGSHFLIQQR